MALTGKEINAIIRERKEKEAAVRLETNAGSLKDLPPLLAQIKLHVGEPDWPTESEIDAEIARSKARRAAKGAK